MTPEELGYIQDSWYETHYYKDSMNPEIALVVRRYYLTLETYEYRGYIHCGKDINSQKDIDIIQIAYNNLQRDLKELNK